jgi:hypothetical protein
MSGDLPIKIEVDNTLPKDTVILRNDRQEVKIINIGNVMTDERLAEIENRVNKAVDGQWEVKHGTYAVHSPLYECWIPQDINDAEFIAHARQDIPDLIAALRTERKTIEQMQSDYTELESELRAERAKVAELTNELNKYTIPRPIEDIHEDHGEVLLWNLPIEYYPDIGGCLNTDFDENLYTHFTLIPNIKDPIDGK